MSVVLLDRGFFSFSVINALERNERGFLMLCTLFGGIRRAVMEYSEGERMRVCRYAIGLEGSRATFTLVILPKTGAARDENDPPKKFIPFATNKPGERVMWNGRRLPIRYRMMRCIESRYIGVEQLN